MLETNRNFPISALTQSTAESTALCVQCEWAFKAKYRFIAFVPSGCCCCDGDSQEKKSDVWYFSLPFLSLSLSLQLSSSHSLEGAVCVVVVDVGRFFEWVTEGWNWTNSTLPSRNRNDGVCEKGKFSFQSPSESDWLRANAPETDKSSEHRER